MPPIAAARVCDGQAGGGATHHLLCARSGVPNAGVVAWALAAAVLLWGRSAGADSVDAGVDAVPAASLDGARPDLTAATRDEGAEAGTPGLRVPPTGDASTSSVSAPPVDAAVWSGPVLPAPAAADPTPPPIAPDQPVLGKSVVTTRRLPSGAAGEDLTASASVVIPDDSSRAVDDLGTLLLEVPGASVTRRGGLGSFTTLSLRGSNPEEVRFYVDGVPLNQAVGGAVDLSTLPLGDVERIEVYRGSSPIVFGQSALGGVVSVVTRTPGAARASVRGGVGSFRTMFADATVGGRLGPVRLYAGVHTLRAVGDFPDSPPDVVGGYRPGTRQNNDIMQWDGVFRAVLPLSGRRELRAGLLMVARDQGLPRENIFRGMAAGLISARGVAHLAYESRDDLGTASRLRALLYGAETRGKVSDPFSELAGRPIETDDRSRSVGATVSAEKALAGWARVVALAEARGEAYQPRQGADSLISTAGHPARRQVVTTGIEVTVPWRATGIDVVPSGRLELFRDTRTEGPQAATGSAHATDRALPVYRLGLSRMFRAEEPQGLRPRLFANVGRYARIPSFVELFGYNGVLVGNPDLVPERGWNADVGAGVTRAPSATSSLLASVTLFGAAVEDLIGWRTFSYQTRAENVSRARIWGLETELRARVGRFGVTTQATLTDARDRGQVAASAGRQIAHHPRYRGYGRAEWRQPAGPLVWSAYGDLEGAAGAYETATAYGALPARLLFGAGLLVEHPSSGVRLTASAMNLGDSRVRDFPGYPLPGRSIFVSLGWFSFHSLTNNPNP